MVAFPIAEIPDYSMCAQFALAVDRFSNVTTSSLRAGPGDDYPDGITGLFRQEAAFHNSRFSSGRSAPQVTGTAALIREVAPQSNAKQVEQAIEQGAELVEGKDDPELGAGRLNAAAALLADAIQ